MLPIAESTALHISTPLPDIYLARKLQQNHQPPFALTKLVQQAVVNMMLPKSEAQRPNITVTIHTSPTHPIHAIDQTQTYFWIRSEHLSDFLPLVALVRAGKVVNLTSFHTLN